MPCMRSNLLNYRRVCLLIKSGLKSSGISDYVHRGHETWYFRVAAIELVIANLNNLCSQVMTKADTMFNFIHSKWVWLGT